MTKNDPKNCDHAPSASPCRLEVCEHEVPSASKLPEVLKRVFGDATVAGIAWATNGTWPVLKIGDATLEVSSPNGFDLSRVYEARVWQVIPDGEASTTLAHEFRWVNGLGACELTLTRRLILPQRYGPQGHLHATRSATRLAGERCNSGTHERHRIHH